LRQDIGVKHQSEKEKRAVETLEVTQDQIFNWAKVKISRWSTTPSLKMILFIWFQISLTTTIHTLPKNELTDKDALHKENWIKFEKGSMGVADTKPNHERHWFQTNQTILQPKNKWFIDSSYTPHKQMNRNYEPQKTYTTNPTEP